MSKRYRIEKGVCRFIPEEAGTKKYTIYLAFDEEETKLSHGLSLPPITFEYIYKPEIINSNIITSYDGLDYTTTINIIFDKSLFLLNSSLPDPIIFINGNVNNKLNIPNISKSLIKTNLIDDYDTIQYSFTGIGYKDIKFWVSIPSNSVYYYDENSENKFTSLEKIVINELKNNSVISGLKLLNATLTNTHTSENEECSQVIRLLFNNSPYTEGKK